MKAFSDWAPRYARHGVATFPVSGKKPAVSNYLRIGIKATDQLAAKFASAESFGFALKRNRIALVDIDTSDPRALEVGLDRFGPSPLVVRTQSGIAAVERADAFGQYGVRQSIFWARVLPSPPQAPWGERALRDRARQPRRSRSTAADA
jgi:hypothetical protein